MECRKCGSNNISIQAVTKTKTKGKGISYWIFGWMIDLLLWIFFTVPRLIVGIFKPRKVVTKTHKMAICQSCGHSWKTR